MALALKVDEKDNVATVFENGVVSGMTVAVRDKAGRTEDIKVIGDVPYGHKIAVKDIETGAPVIKYGESIGAASRDIARGEYVHVHNMVAMRGRGDLAEG